MVTDKTGDELSPQEIWETFEQEYLNRHYPYQLRECHIHTDENGQRHTGTHIKVVVGINSSEITFEGNGNGPIDASVKGLNQHTNLDFALQSYNEHDIDHRSDSRAAAYISIKKKQSGRSAFGVGIDSNISVASMRAILCALNRLESRTM